MDSMHIYNEMLKETIGKGIYELSDKQKKAINLFKSGRNLLILGEAGCGKSFLINELTNYLKTKNIKYAITALTGIAAFNINGITINSFTGIGIAKYNKEILLKRLRKEYIWNIKCIRVLFIDEISMMSSDLFDKLNYIFQNVRKNSSFFGGVQVVFTGDFFQLQPVFNNTDLNTDLLFKNETFLQEFTLKNIINLDFIFRQSDLKFKQILSNIRLGTFTLDDINYLKNNSLKNISDKNSKNFIKLVATNAQANNINKIEIDSIESDLIEFSMIDTNDRDTMSNDKKFLYNELISQLTQKQLINVKLKIGCKVMLVVNLNVEIGLVNGALGVVVGFDKFSNFPIIEFTNNIKQTINPYEFKIEWNNVKLSIFQIPLILGYAITIHKCQSLTLDNIHVDLFNCFCNAQVYVALSRVKTLNGLYIKSINPSKITCCKETLFWYKKNNIL